MNAALVLSEHDLGDWAAGYRAGARSAPLPYGVDALGERGWSLEGSAASTGRWSRKLRDVVEHRTGVVVDRTVHGFAPARRADLVLALLETQGMAAARLKAMRVPPWSSTPLVIWSCWLADDVRRADAATRRRIARRLAAVDLITHMSRHETEILVDLGIPEARLHAVGFGVSQDFFAPAPEVPRDIEVLAVGQDRGRDYATLFDGVRGTDLRVTVVCKPANLVGLSVPENVDVLSPVPLPAYRDLLRRAQVVAVPTHDLAYPTGQSVALEAGSVGACVAVTGTRAMREYFTGSEAALVDVGDADGWRTTLTGLRDDAEERDRLGRAAQGLVRDRFNTRTMWLDVDDAITARGLAPARSA